MRLFDFLKGNKKPAMNVDVSFSAVRASDVEYTKAEQIALFLHFLDGMYAVPKENEEYGYNIKWNCGGITNPQQLHRQLIREGYFAKPAFFDVVTGFKVQDLKVIASANGLETKGLKKTEIVQLLDAQLPDSTQLEIKNNSKYYVLSDKAREYLKSYKGLCYLGDHRDMGIKYQMFKDAAKQYYGTYRDIIWRILNAQLNEAATSNNFTSMAYEYTVMAKFVQEEKRYTDALLFWITSLFIHVNQPLLQSAMLNHVRPEAIMDMIDSEIFPKHIVDEIVSLRAYYTPEILRKIDSWKLLPYVCIPNDVFEILINEVVAESMIDMTTYTEMSIKNAKRLIKKNR